jgi:zinc and cadmium transporter
VRLPFLLTPHPRAVSFGPLMGANLFWYCIILFVAATLGGMVALARNWSEDLLHLFVSFGAGVFLGAVFFELLPEAMSHQNRAVVSIAILVGYLLIFFVEKVMAWHSHSSGGDGRSHIVVSIAAMIGLSVHSLVDGLGMAVSSREAALGETVFLSILAHHVPAAFSLASLLSLSKMKKNTSRLLLVIFAATPPIGALFYSKKIRWQNLVLLVLGILAMAAVSFGVHHVHEL